MLRVLEVVRETEDAATFVLADPDGGQIPFLAGQFFTVLVDLDGTTLRRAYSLSGDPRDTARARITVKRMRDGRVSNHLLDRVRVGDALRVLGPSGNFTITRDPARSRQYVLVAGGSGITPLMSIARAVLVGEPSSTVTLVYGNRGERDVIFRDAFDTLVQAHAPRFVVRHVLEAPPAGWSGGTGRLDRPGFDAQLDALGVDATRAWFYVCGPEPMMSGVREALAARGVPVDHVLEERFTKPAERADAKPAHSTAQPITFRVGDTERTVLAAPDQTVLEAGLAAGLPMPFSCGMGGCAACKVHLLEGDVAMEEPNCLSNDERRAGYVLACVGRACGPCTVAVAT